MGLALEAAEERATNAERLAEEASNEAGLSVAAALEAAGVVGDGEKTQQWQQQSEAAAVAKAVAVAVGEVEEAAAAVNEEAWAEAELLRRKLEQAQLEVQSLERTLEEQQGDDGGEDHVRYRSDEDDNEVDNGGGRGGPSALPRSPEALLMAEEQRMKLEATVDTQRGTMLELEREV